MISVESVCWQYTSSWISKMKINKSVKKPVIFAKLEHNYNTYELDELSW